MNLKQSTTTILLLVGVLALVAGCCLINTPPVARFTVSPSSGIAPLTVLFDASGSLDPDGYITSYIWTFGDGASGSGVTVSHTYSSAGTYTVELMVTDDAGATGTDSAILSVSPPPTPGLVAWWKFDEGSGTTAYDSSGNGNHGTLMAGASYVAGISGTALSLDGVNDYVRVPDANSLDLTTLTIEAWIRFEAVRPPFTGNQGIVNKYRHDKPSEGGYLVFVREGDGALLFRVKDDAGNVAGGNSSWSDVFLTPGVWQHVAGIYDGTTGRLYLNGVLVASQILPITITANNQPLLIGALMDQFANVYRFFGGFIDEVRIYNRALTEEEVQARYNRIRDRLRAVSSLDADRLLAIIPYG